MHKTKLLLLLVLITVTSTHVNTDAFIVSILQELAALTEFNANNRKALYEAFTETVVPESFVPKTCSQEAVSSTQKGPFTFASLAGDIPEDIVEIVEFIDKPERFARVGAKKPKGILLYGPPGTGKTSIARAIAGESGAEFFHASGSEFVEVYVGVGPQRVRELFEKARKAGKSIIFIDEIDAIGGKRFGESNSEYRNTLNELLNQMDGFEQNNITVIAATNRPSDLDDALLRPGRFDRLVEIGLPNARSRTEILRHYCSNIAYEGPEAIFEEIAAKTFGCSGADIKNLVNEAAVFAARENAEQVSDNHLRQALQKIAKQKKRS